MHYHPPRFWLNHDISKSLASRTEKVGLYVADEAYLVGALCKVLPLSPMDR